MERKRDEQTKLIKEKIRELEAAQNTTTSQNPGSSNNNNTGTIPKSYAEKAKDKAEKKEHSRPATDYKTYDEYSLHPSSPSVKKSH